MRIPRLPKIFYQPFRGDPRVLAIAMTIALVPFVPMAIHYHNWHRELQPVPPDPDVMAQREIATRVEGGAEFKIMKVRRVSNLIYPWHEYVVACRSPATARSPGRPEDHVPPGWVFAGRIGYTEVGRYPDRDELTQAALTAIDALHPGPGWIAWQHASLRVSLDGCASWIEFEPWKHLQPSQVLLSGARPCDTRECARIALHNSGTAFSEVSVSRDAPAPRLSFVMTSRALAPAGLAVSSDDGGSMWRTREREVPPAAVAPTVVPEAQAAQPSPQATRRRQALGDEELQAIPMPPVRGDRGLLIARIRDAARRGNVDGVKRAWIKGVFTKPGDDLEVYREAVLAAMSRKAQEASAPPPRAIASTYAIDDAALARIPSPRLQEPSSAPLVAGIRAAAKAGDLSRVMALGLSSGSADREEIDRYVGRIADAMVAAQTKSASMPQ